MLRRVFRRHLTRTKVLAIIGLATICTAGLALMSAFKVYEMSRIEDLEFARGVTRMAKTAELRAAIENESRAIDAYRARSPSARRRLERARQAYDHAQESLRATLYPGEKTPALDALDQLHRKYVSPALGAPTFLGDLGPEVSSKIEAGAQAVVAESESSVRRLHDDVNAKESAALAILALVGAVSLAACAAQANLLYREVLVPLDRLHGVTLDLAGGNLRSRFSNPGPDEFGQVGAAFNQMADAMGNVIHDLTAANEALTQANQLKNQFVSMVSHELRTPLSTIVGYSEFLEDELSGPLTPGQKEYLEEIQAGARRLGTMVEDLLDVARIDSGTFCLERRDVNMGEILRGTLKSLLPQAKAKRIVLEPAVPEAPVIAAIDPGRIDQVLLNLVGNAIKFTPEGGKVAVSLAAQPGAVEVVIEDSGIGISPGQLPRIFDKFYQVDPSSTRAQGGTGLGLFLTRTIVEAHGGQVRVASEIGKGSRFSFSIPLRPPTT